MITANQKRYLSFASVGHIYCSTADLHQMIFTTEYIGAKAFLFHADRKEDDHLYGDALMMDLDTLRQDVKHNILYSFKVNIAPKEGCAIMVSLEKWQTYENYREFAIAPEDLGALDKLVRRETDRLMGNRTEQHKDKNVPSPER